MSIASVKLPDHNSSDSESYSDIEPPQVTPKPKVPVKTEIAVKEDDDNPFEVCEDDDDEMVEPSKNVNYQHLGLPPLTFQSDPFLQRSSR